MKYNIPHTWSRQGMILPRNTEGPGSDVVGDPCIVWDEEIGGWRMFLFFAPPGHGHVICRTPEDVGRGQWSAPEPLTFTNPEALLGGGTQNLHRDYATAIRRAHDLGVMINASFVFGMDQDDDSVFARTVEWAIAQGIETATFHILTPYPGTALYARMREEGRLSSADWERYDTRHVVFSPAKMSAAALEKGYWQAYQDFYRWSAIRQSVLTHDNWAARFRHLAYTGAWKKCEPLWDMLIRLKHVSSVLPALEAVLSGRNQEKNKVNRGLAPSIVKAGNML